MFESFRPLSFDTADRLQNAITWGEKVINEFGVYPQQLELRLRTPETDDLLDQPSAKQSGGNSASALSIREMSLQLKLERQQAEQAAFGVAEMVRHLSGGGKDLEASGVKMSAALLEYVSALMNFELSLRPYQGQESLALSVEDDEGLYPLLQQMTQAGTKFLDHFNSFKAQVELLKTPPV